MCIPIDVECNCLGFWSFEFVSRFDIRISDFSRFSFLENRDLFLREPLELWFVGAVEGKAAAKENHHNRSQDGGARDNMPDFAE
jgi:hypothetical protein